MTSKPRPPSGQTMKGRPPPPSYDETLVRGPGDFVQRFATTGGRSSNGRAPTPGVSAAVDYRSNRSAAPPARRPGGVGEAAALAMAKLLHASGTKVVLYPANRGKPEERTAWADGNEFVLLNNIKSTVQKLNFVGKRKTHYQLADLMTVTLGVPGSEIWANRPSTPGRHVSTTGRRMSDHVPDARSTIRLRFVRETLDLACHTAEESHALYAVLAQHATAPVSAQGYGADTRVSMERGRQSSGVGGGAGGGGGSGAAAAAIRSGHFNSYQGGTGGSRQLEGLDESYRPPPAPKGSAVRNGGPKKQRSNLREMIPQPAEYTQARNVFLADDNLDNGVDAASAMLKPHTLAEVSGAVPQTPTCYVAREEETLTLTEFLVPSDESETIGGSTSVIFDTVANGKSVLAAAAMQDPRVQAAFPGGVMWLRAGRAAAGRLPRMMELAVCQITEEMERSGRGTLFRVPERFNNVSAASDFLASLLIRTTPGRGPRGTLLVLDDVWEASVVEAFETVGLSLLVTTREPLIARLATPDACGERRLIGPLGPITAEQATLAVAKAAATRLAPFKEAKQLLERTGRCPLAVGVVGSTLKQAQGALEWSSTSSKVKKTYAGLQRRRQARRPNLLEEYEDRITASIAAGLSNMPEENQMLYSALCILPPGLPVSCRLLEQVWETGKRTTILAAEAFEHRRLLDRLGPGNFVLHYEASKFLQNPSGFAGDGAWVGCKLRGQGRELAFNRLCKHLDSFDTLRDHLAKRDLWGLKELWSTCELEAKKTSGHSHVSCRIYESRLDLLRQEADIVAGPGSKARASTAKLACEATLDLAQALDMVADFQAYGGCCDAAPLYRESIDSLRQSLEFAALQGNGSMALESRVKRALERITGKLGSLLLKHGKGRDALHPCAESLSLIRARQGTEGPDGGAGLGMSSKSQPHQDVVDTLYSMAEALMMGDSVGEAEGMYEEAAIVLRRLYGEDACLCLEARGTEQLGQMMMDAGRMPQAEALNEQCLTESTKAYGNIHPVVARVMDQKGAMMLKNKDLAGASSWFTEARQIREAFYGKGHALVAPSLEKQALLEMSAGEERGAGMLLKECLAMQEERYGPNDVRVMETCEKLAQTMAEAKVTEKKRTKELDTRSPVRIHAIGGGKAAPHMEEAAPSPKLFPSVGGAGGGGAAVMDQEEVYIRKALKSAEASAAKDGGREAAELLGRLARLLGDYGSSRIADAEEAYHRWMERLQTETDGKLAGTEVQLAECISEYIDVLEAQGKDLESLMWDLVNLDKRVFGTDSLELAKDMERFGRYMVTKQSYGQAEQLLKRALSIKEKNRGKDHPEIAGILRAIGSVLFEVNGLKDAGEMFDRALTIDQKGHAPADVVEDMLSLGMVYCRQGIYDKAETMYRKVVDMDRTLKNGEEDPSVITEINVLAVLLYAQGKMDQAEPLLKRVLALREKVLGPDHVDAAESLVNLAVLYNKKGKHAIALPMLNRALNILEKAHGSQHPETVACLSWIAETHQKQAEFPEAETILLEVVSLNRQILGDEHPGVADSLSDLAELRRAQGKLDEAEACHLEAMYIREAYYGPEHDSVAQSAQYLSLLLLNAGREGEAQDYGRRVVAIREKVHAAGGGTTRRTNTRRDGSPQGSPAGYGENARRDHARVAVEKSITHLM